MKSFIPKTYLVFQVAKEVGVHVNTVRAWERKGVIQAQRDYRGYRVFSEKELLKAKERIKHTNFNQKVLSKGLSESPNGKAGNGL